MTPTVVRVGEPDELLSLVPYLLGFHPKQSLVVLALSGERVVLTARLDLDADRLLDGPRVAAIAAGSGADRLVLVAYAANGGEAADLVDLFVGLVSDTLDVDEAWRVHERRFWCLVPGCGCARAREFDPGATSAAAQAVLAGLRVVESRETLLGVVAEPRGAALAEVEAAYESVGPTVAGSSDEERRDRLALLVEGFLASPRRLGVEECAELSMLVRFAEVRDVATTRVRRADAELHLDLWGQVARSAAEPFAVAAVCLAGLAAWVSGDGALLNVCIERAEQCDPGFPLLQILCDISDGGIPPSCWDDICDEMREVA